MRRLRPVVLVLLAGLLCAPPAPAFAPPALYVRLTHANSIDHTPVSDWIALSSAPTLNWLGGYEIGYAPEPGAQRAALQVTGVPDGQATQPLNTPFCTGGLPVPAGGMRRWAWRSSSRAAARTPSKLGSGRLPADRRTVSPAPGAPCRRARSR